MLQFLFHNSQFGLTVLPLLLLILPQWEAVVWSCPARKVFLPYFSFLEISPFLKNHSGGCFCINTHCVYFPTTNFRLFKNDVAHFFLAEYFSGLICRLGKIVSSVCKTLSQKPIFNLVKHLGWSFSCEKVNSSTPLGIFAKKAPLQMFNHVLNAPQ